MSPIAVHSCNWSSCSKCNIWFWAWLFQECYNTFPLLKRGIQASNFIFDCFFFLFKLLPIIMQYFKQQYLVTKKLKLYFGLSSMGHFQFRFMDGSQHFFKHCVCIDSLLHIIDLQYVYSLKCEYWISYIQKKLSQGRISITSA